MTLSLLGERGAVKPLFPPWSNSAYRLVLFLVAVVLIGIPTALMILVRTPYMTGENETVDQPIQFDHRHHYGDDGIQCLYCHSEAETSPFAGVPPVSLCMNCHNQVWPDAPLLRKVRASYFTGEPIRWKRVNDLPDFVFFNHAVHVTKGVACVTCHGRVDLMPMVMQAEPLTMQWCLECHRNPQPHLRPPQLVTDMDWQPPPGGVPPQALPQVNPPTHCTGCHR